MLIVSSRWLCPPPVVICPHTAAKLHSHLLWFLGPFTLDELSNVRVCLHCPVRMDANPCLVSPLRTIDPAQREEWSVRSFVYCFSLSMFMILEPSINGCYSLWLCCCCCLYSVGGCRLLYSEALDLWELPLPENMPLTVSVMFFISAAPHDIHMHSLVTLVALPLLLLSLISRRYYYACIAWAGYCVAVRAVKQHQQISDLRFLASNFGMGKPGNVQPWALSIIIGR